MSYASKIEELIAERERLEREVERLRLALRTLKIAINVGAPEYGYDDWMDIIDAAMAKEPKP